MNLRSKLIVAFTMVALVPLVGGAIGLFAHRDAVASAHALQVTANTRDQLTRAAHEAELHFQRQSAAASIGEKAAFATHGKVVAEALAQLTQLAPKLGLQTASVSAAQALHADYERTWTTRGSDAAPAPGGRLETSEREAPVARALTALTEQIAARGESLRATESERLHRRGRVLDALMFFGTIAGVMLGAGFGWMTSNAVSRHIRDVSRRLWDGTRSMAATAGEVTGLSQRVAQASSEQASALAAGTQALADVNTNVRQNASHAQAAYQLSRTSRQAADTSAAEVKDLQDAMRAIRGASAKIATIVKSIDEIAFQTNLLALNAAVEAARAGEAGAGFAVVANEVRTLAQRSAQASGETGNMIRDAVAKGQRGEELADRVSQSLMVLIEDTRKVDGLIGEIAVASQQQAGGIEQAVTSTSQIDRLTQENAHHAEQTAAAAQRLESQMAEFKHQLTRLLGEESTAGHADSQSDAQRMASAPALRSGLMAPAESVRRSARIHPVTPRRPVVHNSVH